jgi:hypothetical protein
MTVLAGSGDAGASNVGEDGNDRKRPLFFVLMTNDDVIFSQCLLLIPLALLCALSIPRILSMWYLSRRYEAGEKREERREQRSVKRREVKR